MEVSEGREVDDDSKDEAASSPDCWLINGSVVSARRLLSDFCEFTPCVLPSGE